MPRFNKPISTKIQQIPKILQNLEINLANMKISATKHQKKPNKFDSQKKSPNPDFAHKKHEKRKTQTKILLTKTRKEPSNQVLQFPQSHKTSHP